MRWIVVCIFIQLPFFITKAINLFPYINHAVNPCDNFYNFACGNFESVHPVPTTFTSWDEFIRLQKIIDEQLKELLESEKNEGDSKSFTKARKMYASCADLTTRNRRGIYPLRRILRGWPKIENSASLTITSTDWMKMANLIANYGVQFIFKLTVRADVLNATRTSIYIESDDLTLPTSLLQQSVEILDNDLSSRTDSAFTEYLANVMTVLNDFNRGDMDDQDILTTARRINEFMLVLNNAAALDFGEETTTSHIIPSVGSTTLLDLQTWTDAVLAEFPDPINWGPYLRTVFKKSGVKVDNDTQIFITNRVLLRNLLILAHKTEKELMDNFVYSRLATYMAPESSSQLYEIAMDFYVVRGYVPPGYPKWKYCLHKVLDFPKIGLSFAVAQKYRETYVSEETVDRAKNMVENLRDAMEELIEESDWMDETTKNYAIYKLNNILILTGNPDYLETQTEVDRYYKKLKIYRNDHFGNMNRLRSFNQAKNFAELGGPRDRNLWTQSPLIVNAYYNGINNRILFPISTMMKPFFFGTGGSFLDYARIGSIMAHELTHAFDSQGKLLDAEGSMVSWWSQSTRDIYATKTECFVEQYNKYVILGSNLTVNGEYTLAENIADNVGLRASFRAFKNQRNRVLSSTSETDLFTAEQEFHLAFASIWCHVGSMVSSDHHAPHKYRVLGPIENTQDFDKIWQCKGYNEAAGSSSTSVEKDVCVLW